MTNEKQARELLTDLAEYTKQTINETYKKVLTGLQQVQQAWNKHEGTEKEFYTNCEAYLYDLTLFNLSPGRLEYNKNLSNDKTITGRILEYGSGIGQTAIEYKKNNPKAKLTITDLDCPSYKFSQYRIKKHDYNITTITTTKLENTNTKYDTILSFDVLEHLDDKEFTKTIELFKKISHKKTRFIFQICFGKTKLQPMHHEGSEWKIEKIKELIKR